MNRTEKLALLAEWQHEIERANAGFEPLSDALGGFGESRPEMAFAFLQDAYTRAAAKLLGDQDSTLAWYSLENDFGRKALRAGPEGGTRAIASFEDLLWLLEVSA